MNGDNNEEKFEEWMKLDKLHGNGRNGFNGKHVMKIENSEYSVKKEQNGAKFFRPKLQYLAAASTKAFQVYLLRVYTNSAENCGYSII